MTLSSIFGGTKGQHLQDGRQRTCEDFFGLWESFLAQLAFGAVWITVSVRVKYARRGCCGLCKIVSDYVKLCFVLWSYVDFVFLRILCPFFLLELQHLLVKSATNCFGLWNPSQSPGFACLSCWLPGRLSTAAVMRQSSCVLAPNGQVNHVFFAALPDDFRSAELQLPEAILVLLHIISWFFLANMSTTAFGIPALKPSFFSASKCRS